ncbi:hypothetical protein AVEN_203333-1 [Araneus ventricosus]|uniref:Reverse transcriptase domain-containing protein n=1 Tax=Araneus ventricosus TaxID=182803 RepID=A0A4Y2H3V4_ARAVE|nr:hypothetical protein AVEN_203333-1 [Araneus ventricosus]
MFESYMIDQSMMAIRRLHTIFWISYLLFHFLLSSLYSGSPNDVPFTVQEAVHVIKSLPNRKAPGINGIDNLVLNSLHRAFPDLLLNFFNKCLEHSTFSDSSKISNVILFQKNPVQIRKFQHHIDQYLFYQL